MAIRNLFKSPFWMMAQGFSFGVFATAAVSESAQPRLFWVALALLALSCVAQIVAPNLPDRQPV